MGLLDARLTAVLELVPDGASLLDIGTDHCKLPAEGLLCKKLNKAFAADLRQGPLDAAQRQLAAVGLADQIPLFLSDGLQSIPKEILQEVDAVAIAGMGGEVIASIIEDAPVTPPLYILQPMSAVYELMDFMAKRGLKPIKGKLSADKDKIYRIFTVCQTKDAYTPDYFSIHKGDPLYDAFLEKEERRVLAALAGLKKAKTPDEKRIRQEEDLLLQIRKAKND